MIQTIEAVNGGYRFMPSVSQYSCGIAALAGFGIERISFSNVVPLKQGFEKIAEIIKAAGRQLTAFGACELRSPAPSTEDGFKAFNETYIKTLVEWGVMTASIRWRAAMSVRKSTRLPNRDFMPSRSRRQRRARGVVRHFRQRRVR